MGGSRATGTATADSDWDLGVYYREPLARWRLHRDFSLAHARRAAGLGNEVVALGQLSRAVVEEAHARHCAAGRWVLNEKRIQEGMGLPVRLPPGEPSQVVQTVAQLLAEQNG